MKKLIIAGTGILAIAILIVISTDQGETEPYNPLPTDVKIVNEEDENSHIEKAKWIEEMHFSAPGDDWRQIDQDNLSKLRESRSALRNMKSGSKAVDISDGRLIGEWNEKGAHNMAGRMHCIDVDFENEHVYGASSGGQIWRGSLEGENWTSLTEQNQVKGIVFLRAIRKQDGGTRLMMATNNGSFLASKIFQYSDDDGNSWSGAMGLVRNKGNNLKRAVSQPDGTIYLLLYRGGWSYIMRSKNLGEDFEEVDNIRSSSMVDIWTPRFDQDKLYFLDKDELFILNEQDELESLGLVALNFSTDIIERIQLNGCLSEGNTYLHIMYRLENSTRFIVSENGGESWILREQLEKGPFMTNSFGVSTVNPNLMGFGEVNAHRSRDGGATWEIINGWGEYYQNMASKLHADVPEIEFIRKPDGGELCFISTDGGTFVSDNNLDGVRNISLTGLHTSQYYSTYTHREYSNIIYAGSQDQGFQRAIEESDGIVNVEQTISGDYGHIVSSDGGKSLWTVYPGFAMRYASAAGGNAAVMWDFAGDNHLWLPPLMADPYFPEKVYLAGGTSNTGNHLWHLNHGPGGIGATELPYDFSAGTDARISAMAFSPINKDYRYVLNTYGKFFYSSDRGTSWEKSSNRGPGSHYFYGSDIVPDVNDINTIYLSGSGYSSHSVWVSHNGGKSFDPMSNGLPNTLVFAMAINEDGTLLFAASEIGPFVWIKSENKWYDLSAGVAPEQTYWSVDYVPALRTARFGTYGRGIWDFKVTEYTGMSEILAHRESMGLNIYPNPVKDLANIDVNLPVAGDLTIRILNAAGQSLIEYKKENQPAGQIIQQIDMQEFSPGIYFVQTKSGNRINIRKIIRQ